MEKAQVNMLVIALILIILIGFAYIQFSPTGFALRRILPKEGGDGGGDGDTSVTTTTSIIITCIDVDKDGYGSNCLLGNDCNDANININPAANELCGNNVDEDCDNIKQACSNINAEVIVDSNNYLYQGGKLVAT